MMMGRTLPPRMSVGLWLLAVLAAGSAAAQNLYVGPGVVIIRQYRPGATLYSPNTYGYIEPNPFIYGPLTGTNLQIYSLPRVQQRIPMDVGIGTVPPSPYREYYTPHIPRYYRHQDQPQQTETPATPTPQSNAAESPASKETTPAPGEPERVEQGNGAEAPLAETEQIAPPAGDQIQRRESLTGERTRKPARRKPIRYR